MMTAVFQCSGAGKLRPNILLIGFKNNWQACPPQEVDEFFRMIQ
jgi:solute carrier family 12 sodium/potassium/chloride transporter 2